MLQKAENTTSPYAEVNQSYLCMMPEGTAALVTGGMPLCQREGVAPGRFFFFFFLLRHVT